MKARPISLLPLSWLMGLALALAAGPSQAAPIRVTTWDLQPGVVGATNGLSKKFEQGLIQEAAQRLKTLRPDVILLQQVSGWEACHQLVEALGPDTFQVAICSSFHDARGKLLSRQVAILAKAKAYLAWAEPWQKNTASPASPAGFAFAALHLGNKNVGIFSVQFSEGDFSGADDSRSAQWQAARSESARELVQQLALLQSWKNNRPETFIVAGDFETTPDDGREENERTLSLLEQAGFDNAFAGLPLERRITLPGDGRRPSATLDYIFTREAGLVGSALTSQSPLFEHAAVTCEMDFAAPKAAPAPPPPTLVVKVAPTPPQLAASNSSPPPTPIPLGASNAAPAPTVLVSSNAVPKPSPIAVSNALATSSPSGVTNAVATPLPLAATNSSTTPPKAELRAESPPGKAASNAKNVARAPVAPANAATSAAGPQALFRLGGILAAGLVLFLLARRIIQQAVPAVFAEATADGKARTGSSITRAQTDQIMIAARPESPTYGRIEVEGSMQVPSRTWRPQAEGGRSPARMDDGVRAGVIANISRWLKEKAVLRLVSDRARLLAAQQAAELTVLAVDQRLARIERQMQQINQDYERRIDDLLKELIAAKEENRELIHAKIALVKAEMEKARLRAGQPAREHQQY